MVEDKMKPSPAPSPPEHKALGECINRKNNNKP
jgi:hypothetical protein